MPPACSRAHQSSNPITWQRSNCKHKLRSWRWSACSCQQTCTWCSWLVLSPTLAPHVGCGPIRTLRGLALATRCYNIFKEPTMRRGVAPRQLRLGTLLLLLGLAVMTQAQDPLLLGVLGAGYRSNADVTGGANGRQQQQEEVGEAGGSLPLQRRRVLLEGPENVGVEADDPLDAAVFATPHHREAEQELQQEAGHAEHAEVQEGSTAGSQGGQDLVQEGQGLGEGREAPQPHATGQGPGRVSALQRLRERAEQVRAAKAQHLSGARSEQGEAGPRHAPQSGGQQQQQQLGVQREEDPRAPIKDRRPKDLPAWRQAPKLAEQEQQQQEQGDGGAGSGPLDPLEAAVFQTELKLPQEGLQEQQQQQQQQQRVVPRRPRRQQPRAQAQREAAQPLLRHAHEGGGGEGNDAREAAVFQTPHHRIAEEAIAKEQERQLEQQQQGGSQAPAGHPTASHPSGGGDLEQQLFGGGGVRLGSGAPGTVLGRQAQAMQHGQHGSRQLGERSGGVGAGGLEAGGQQAPQQAQRIPVVNVLVMTVSMAAAAGLGALPFFFVKSLSKQMSGLATAVACGVMFACSFDLVHSGQPYGARLVVLGVVLGGIFIRASQQWLEGLEDVKFENLQGAGARKTLLLVGVMAAHALGEGCGVGVSFVGDHGWSQGVLTTLAIGIHNVPEGLAKATVLVSQGVGARNALLWSVLTCLPQPLVALPSFLFVEAFKAILPIALGFAGGCMIWIVFAELLPDAFEAASPKQVASAATLSAAALEGVRMFFEDLDVQGRLSVPNPFPGDLSLLLPALGVMLPAVASAALAGGLLSNAGLPTAVNFGLASALMGAMGLLPLLRALLPLGGHAVGRALGAAAAGPGGASGALHATAGAASGALLVLLLRHQLLTLLRRGGGALGWSGSARGRSFVDLEAAAKKSSDTNLTSLAHGHSTSNGHYANGQHEGSAAQLFATAYPLLHAGPAGSGGLLGRSPRGPTLQAYANGGPSATAAAAPMEAALADFLGSWGLTLHAKEKGARGLKLAAPQYAACATAALVLAAHAVAQGWHAAGSMLALAPDLSSLLLPAALALLPLGATGGALAAATSQPSPARGAWAGGLLAGGTALWTLLAVARFDPSSGAGTAVAYDPGFVTARLGAVTGGALCMAAFIMLGVGLSVHGRRARGGLLLGGLLSLAVYGFSGALCLLSPYCLNVPPNA